MLLKNIIDKIEIWEDWCERYNYFIPLFINEATHKENWADWDKDVFYEFFERSNNQCVSSLRQGYFTKDEQTKIKSNWHQLAPHLKQLAESQDVPLWNEYNTIQQIIRAYTNVNRKAATYRLIASLQPNLLCTVVNENNLWQIYNYLRENTDGAIPKQTFNWFKDSNQLWQLYKDCFPEKDPKELVTYPWQTKVFFEEDYNTDNDMSDNSTLKDQAIELLKYKKQIILQGPPGTGKTRLAKEIAKELTIPASITKEDVERIIHVGIMIDSATQYTRYTIKEIGANNVTVSLENTNTEYKPSYREIATAFETKMWKGGQTKGNDPYAAAVAKFIYNNWEPSTEIFKLIQFHPSYSYEDFVRGIVAESKGEKIEYKNVNKTIGLFADKALANWNDSKKDVAHISKEKKAREYFEMFVDQINDHLTDGITVLKLTNKVSITDVEEDAFRYKGNEGWTALGNRMLFKDILQACLDENKVRQDIQKNKNLSGLAKQHASYFIRVVNMFQDFLTQNKLGFENLISEKVQLKKYVLIIDEINRANLSSVLGELIYALEYRDEPVESMYAINGENNLVLPSNLFIIGTMNTADRSVGHIDYAIRRRFAFVDVLPKVIDENFYTELFEKVSRLFIKSEIEAIDNIKRSEHLSEEFRPQDVWLGHSYFIQKKDASKEVRLKYEIIPILEEYVKDGVLKESANTIINELKDLCR